MEPHDEHLTAEMIARYWRGEISREEFLLFVVGHLARRCPPCRGELEAVQVYVRSQQVSWVNSLAWRSVEARLAVELPDEQARLERAQRETAALRSLTSWDERTQRVARSRHWYRTEESALALIQEARGCLPGDPESSMQWAHLALEVASRAGAAERSFRSAWLVALAFEANALRITGALQEAELLFDECLRFSREQLHGDPYALAEVYRLRASLLRDQGSLERAAEVLQTTLHLYQQLQEQEAEAKCWIKLAAVYHEAGLQAPAENAGRRAVALVESEKGSWTWLSSVHSLAVILSRSSKGVSEAAALFSSMDGLYQQYSAAENHRLWLRGLIAAGLRADEEAVGWLLDARKGFLAKGDLYHAARVGLDLASLHKRHGRIHQLRTLAAAAAEEFRQVEFSHRETTKALELLNASSSH